VKIPFVVSNAIRIAFFAALTLAAFAWAADIIEPFDPFKIFNPVVLSIGGILFAAALLTASLFVYRPWCHFLCPFGLTGWLVEKISLVKIQVNYDSCIACGSCAKACPSTVMSVILKRNKPIPDCFSCGTCMQVCPTRSIDFRFGKRKLPPAGKFKDILW
jgi:polyferredoxin